MRQLLASIGVSCVALVAAQAAETGLVAHYKFNEGSGRKALDSSGLGNDAKIVGGKFAREGDGFSLLLDAEEAYVDAGSRPCFQGGSGGAFSLWFKPRKLRGGLVNWSKGSGWEDIRLTLAFNTFYEGHAFLANVADGKRYQSMNLPRSHMCPGVSMTWNSWALTRPWKMMLVRSNPM